MCSVLRRLECELTELILKFDPVLRPETDGALSVDREHADPRGRRVLRTHQS